jgi:magnesium-protoporphyrin O-methyltransferase
MRDDAKLLTRDLVNRRPEPRQDYRQTRDRVETYFDRTATRKWEELTSDAEVSRIRQTVRAGRDRMRALMLGRLPADLTGRRILDAGCGTGQMTAELAARGADVVATDISPQLVGIAERRLPDALRDRVLFTAGDMLAPDLGEFDHVLAMDSLIYYDADDVGRAIAALQARTRGSILFTVAPRTRALMAMWYGGKLFPQGDRSPRMVPQDPAKLAQAAKGQGVSGMMQSVDRVSSGFYISQLLEVRR